MKKNLFAISLLLAMAPYHHAMPQSFYNIDNPPFFIPQSELAPRYEKLPPIGRPQSSAPQSQVRARRYIAVDGRYIPVIEKTDSRSENESDTNIQSPTETGFPENIMPETELAETENVDIPADKLIEAEVQPPVIEEIAQIVNKNVPGKEITPPQTTAIDPTLPKYRNRYAQYLDQLLVFRQTKQMPYNQELEDVLAKINNNAFVILYQDTVNPL